ALPRPPAPPLFPYTTPFRSSMRSYPDFEKPVAELEAKVAELRALETSDSAAAIGEEISRLEARAAQVLKDLYAELTPPWPRVRRSEEHTSELQSLTNLVCRL